MQTMEGVVTLAQESRFQLVDDAGIAHLFVLAHGAAAEPAQVAALQKRQARIRVTWDETPNLIARVAHRVTLCDSGTAAGAA